MEALKTFPAKAEILLQAGRPHEETIWRAVTIRYLLE